MFDGNFLQYHFATRVWLQVTSQYTVVIIQVKLSSQFGTQCLYLFTVIFVLIGETLFINDKFSADSNIQKQALFFPHTLVYRI